MKRAPLRLLFLLGLALLFGCASPAPQPPSTPVRYLYVESVDRPTFELPNVLSTLNASNGKLLWAYHPTSQGITSPVPGTDLVYVGSTDQHVYGFNASDGKLRWQAQIGELPQVEAVANGSVLVFADQSTATAEDGIVYALGASAGKVLWQVDLRAEVPLDGVEARHDIGEALPFYPDGGGGFVEFSTLICLHNPTGCATRFNESSDCLSAFFFSEKCILFRILWAGASQEYRALAQSH